MILNINVLKYLTIENETFEVEIGPIFIKLLSKKDSLKLVKKKDFP